MIDVLCIFVLDLDPSNARFGLRFADFGWNPRVLLELGRILIPLVSVGLRLQIHRNRISLRCFIFRYDLVASLWLIREIG
jgi:hypothetical protein